MLKRSTRVPSLLVFVLVGMLLVSCGPNALTAPAAAEEIRSTRPRSAVQVTADDLGSLTAGNMAFALDLYHALGQENGNLFFSPHSISQALAMTYAGAASTTAEQMRASLHFTLPDDRLHAAFNALEMRLAPDEQVHEQDISAGAFTLQQINALWGQRDHPFRPDFLDLLSEQYGAGLRVLDSQRDPEAARVRINTWVEEQTEQQITNLMPQGSITSDTRLVLANAIYFKAKWIAPFDPSITRDEPFTRMDGSAVTAPLMNLTTTFEYNAGPDFQAVQLNYHGDVAMVVLLPAQDQFQAFEATLTAERFQEILQGLAPREVWLTLPKLNYTSPGFRLKPTLEGLGMADAFTFGRADFSAMDGTRDLFIGDVHHKAAVIVDEEGTEAAAATGVGVMAGSALVEPPIEMRVDRPFMFLIRDTRTGAVLFVGRIVDPTR